MNLFFAFYESMKRTQDFHFKQFSIQHDKAAHKVGTDAVLLGAWVDVSMAKRILDVGTGSGVIALMIAQRTGSSVFIDGVEIQETDAIQALQNVARSPWATRVKIRHTSIEDFNESNSYDLIVSNPPFFVNSSMPPVRERGIARHTNELTFESLLIATKRLLNSNGTLVVILPPEESKIFSSMAESDGYFLNRTLHVKSRPDKAVERVLMEFSRVEKPLQSKSLTIHDAGNEWSSDYRELTKDFYLKF
jgi:tRNA1Val (adenine37-N6)-methyltransferase